MSEEEGYENALKENRRGGGGGWCAHGIISILCVPLTGGVMHSQVDETPLNKFPKNLQEDMLSEVDCFHPYVRG